MKRRNPVWLRLPRFQIAAVRMPLIRKQSANLRPAHRRPTVRGLVAITAYPVVFIELCQKPTVAITLRALHRQLHRQLHRRWRGFDGVLAAGLAQGGITLGIKQGRRQAGLARDGVYLAFAASASTGLFRI